MGTFGIIILVIVIIGVITGIMSWIHDAKGEGGLTGCSIMGGLGGIGCLYEILPVLIVIAIIMYCCS